MFRVFCVVSVGLLAGNLTALAQPPQQKPEKEHKWLEQFVGTWDSKSEASMGPDPAPLKGEGTMTCRNLGGFWLHNEMKVTMAGASVTGIQTIGYNAKKKKYVGTWVDSMSDFMWHYEGTVDEAGKKLTLNTEGPNHQGGGKLSKYRDAYEFKSADVVIATSEMLMDDGKWVTFMTGTMTRRK